MPEWSKGEHLRCFVEIRVGSNPTSDIRPHSSVVERLTSNQKVPSSILGESNFQLLYILVYL